MQAPSKTEAFIFDLFGVIIAFDNSIVYSRLARHCANPEDAVRQLDGLMASRDVITGRLTLQQIYGRLVEVHGLTLGYPDFEAAWLEPYSWPMPGMIELVTALSVNYPLLLLSNIDAYYWRVVRAAHSELECFKALLLSCDLGMAKPDPEIFLRASQAAGADPSRCFFIDDTSANVEAARALGFQAYRFRSAPELRQELEGSQTKGSVGDRAESTPD
jgi:HAD superfamily hydrolase (TIGR01509 family)